MGGLDRARLERLGGMMAGHVERGSTGGVGWLAARGDDVEVGTVGVLTRGEPEPIRRDSLFRIASMTKPVAAVGALILVEEGRLRLDRPVDGPLPQPADPRGPVHGRGPLDGAALPARPA